MGCCTQVPGDNSDTQTRTVSNPWLPLSKSSWVVKVTMSRIDSEIVSEQIQSAHRGQQCLHRAYSTSLPHQAL